MKKLVNVDGWVCPMNERTGKYIDEQGQGLSGFYRKDDKDSCDMLVLDNGKLRARYKYPRVQIPFTHPMMRWMNLSYCGGYHITDPNGKVINDDNIVEATVAGKKPIGFVSGSKEEVRSIAKLAEQNGCEYYIQSEPNWHGCYEVGISNEGTFGENFDIEALIESYRILSEAQYPGFRFLKKEDEYTLRALANKKISEYLDGFDYANPESNLEVVITGLILGYPIESTFSCQTGLLK